MDIQERSEIVEHRQKMVALQHVLMQVDEKDHVELKSEHFFADGTYTRKTYIPAGILCVGKIHRYSCINMLVAGRGLVATDDSEGEIIAPFEWVSGPGIQKAVYAIEDMIWITVHAWDGLPDLDQIEDKVIVKSYEELDQERLWLGQ